MSRIPTSVHAVICFLPVRYPCAVPLKFSVLSALLSQAILGGTVDVLTLDGMVSMKIPAGTQPDDVLLLRGKGIKLVNSASRR